jgi:hypothetical protein
MKSILRRIGFLAAVVSVMAACSGEPSTAPAVQNSESTVKAPEASSSSLLGLNLNLNLVGNVLRTQPLPSNITVTKTIGSAGGTLSIPAAGVTVTIPSGALSSNTVITMTARAGYVVAYDFAPHGITFAKPLTFTQKLQGTNVSLLNVLLLHLGYYSDPSLLGTVTSLVSELIGGTTNLLTWQFSAPIKHFSGYVMACGRGDD